MLEQQPKDHSQDDAKLPNLKGAFWLAKILACAGVVFFGYEYLFYYGDVARIEGEEKSRVINGFKNPYQIEKLKCHFNMTRIHPEDDTEIKIGFVMIFKISDDMAALTIKNNGLNLNQFKPTYHGKNWIFPKNSNSIIVSDKNYSWQNIREENKLFIDYGINLTNLNKKINFFINKSSELYEYTQYSYLVAPRCKFPIVNMKSKHSYKFIQIQRDAVYYNVISADQKEMVSIGLIDQFSDFFYNREQGFQ